MEQLKFKNRPPFQSKEMDEIIKMIGKTNLAKFKDLLVGQRITTSTFYHYQNKMDCYLYFDNGNTPEDVVTLTNIAETTIRNYYKNYLIDNPK